MKLRILLIVLTGFFLTVLKAQQSFVTVKEQQFFIGKTPYKYIGANYWYGAYLGLGKDNRKGLARLKKELDFLHQHGVQNLRVLAGAEGSGQINGVQRVGPPLQPQQGVFDKSQLYGLDILLQEIGKRNMKAVIILSNNWEWSGGFMQYANWNGLLPDSILKRKLTWDEQRDYTSTFYNCDNCKQAYLKQLRFIINRVNILTGKKYTEDPTIMSWELANEPRPMRPSANENYLKWINNIAGEIKAIDKHHLVTLGHEGVMGVDGDTALYQQAHAGKNIDYLTIHIWPKNWSWFNDATLEQDMPVVRTNTVNYIEQHAAIASVLRKPLVIEEFGLPRDNVSFSLASSTVFRDHYYQIIFSQLKDNPAIAGANFWAFGGYAKPIAGQTFWKNGDDYMGDPPMEEQGLNSVFVSDSSTWKVINDFNPSRKNPITTRHLPADHLATKETVAFYKNLKKLRSKGIMFGHQDDLAYGATWKYENGRSDVKDVTGDYPAVYGWELGNLEKDQLVNLDSVPFDKMKMFIKQVYERGGVNTISWHFGNPLNGKSAWDTATGAVASILPGGAKHDLYKSWLNKLALFMNSLKGSKGEMIPVIFRPFHELNGNWFWWGQNYCTPGEFKAAYQFTINYLRNTKHIHHLLIAYNTDRFGSKEEYLSRFPGAEYVDVIGFDIYQRKEGENANRKFIYDTDKMLTTVEQIADEKGLIPALTEFGCPQVPDSSWFTNVLWQALKNHRISYALAWRNAGIKPSGENEYYLPYKGQLSEQDFKRFYEHPKTLFQKEVSSQNLYKN